ncbi:protein moonraker isoform X2 [Gadus macrocephalus]|uniref:protein moonraker isoform X2 n=1 Tax=Gadus macrocephalus TaxID=80720 RepID=UPI0028CB3650|nr:protein moonraker isoform X2 [Gadus macrocephalus]
MTSHPSHRGPRSEWVVSEPNYKIHSRSTSAGPFQTQLLFNETIPSSSSNRASRTGPPSPIVIEKLVPRSEEPERPGSSRSSVNFSTLSEERLMAAVRLAKRDLRRRRQETLRCSAAARPPSEEESAQDTSSMDSEQENEASFISGPKTSSPKEKATRSGARFLVQSPQRRSVLAGFGQGKSPPTKDPGMGPSARSHQPQLSREIQKVQKELLVYIEKVENRGQKAEEPLEQEEQQKKEIHCQKQAAYSARIIYGLQQQVKDIQEEMEKPCPQRDRSTKKSKAVDRLAAAHRSALRAMRVFTQQLSEPPVGKVPSHHRELSQLLRQLAHRAATVEVDPGSTVPSTALEVLQRLETLDSAFSEQDRSQQRQAPARRSSSLPRGRSPPPRHRSTPRAPGGAPLGRGPGRHKAVGPRKSIHGRRRAPPPRVPPRGAPCQPGGRGQPVGRSQALRAGLESLLQQRALQAESREQPEPQTHGGGGGERERSRSHPVRGDTGFRQPTVSSQLRVSQPPPQREPSVPWVPASPHSPPRPAPRSPREGRPEPRCLFSPPKAPPSPPRPSEARGPKAEQLIFSDQRSRAQNEALRQVWLERTTMQRLRELNQLSRAEAEHIHRLRSEVSSPTRWAQRAEQEARDKIQPLLDEARRVGGARRDRSPSPQQRRSGQERAVGSEEQVSAEHLEELLDETERAAWASEADEEARRRLGAPTLEGMLLRMEEIQKDEDAVRRRFAAIAYADPPSWSSAQQPGIQGQALGSNPASPQPIRLTRPVHRHSPVPHIVLEEPVETGLAEQLLEEALAGVAAEFQDACEDYAEAVFTSEFLRPAQSPPGPAPPTPSLGLV